MRLAVVLSQAALAGDGDDVSDELAALRAEADLPIEELRRLATAENGGEEEEAFSSDGFDSELDLEGEDDDAYRGGGGGVEVSRLLDEAVGAGVDEEGDGEYEEEEDGGGDGVDDEATLLEEEERAAREGDGEGGAADRGGEVRVLS